MIDKWYMAEDYACYKYYSVSYEIEGTYISRTVRGVLLALACGKVALLTENGISMIPLRDVKYMQPSKPKMEMFEKEYQEILKKLLDVSEGN